MTSALAKIHIGKKELGLDDDTYRAYLRQLVGQDSAKGLSERQMGRVIEDMQQKGAFKSLLNTARRPLEGAYAKKLQSLWIAGYNLGIIRGKDDKALLAFVERQTGLSHMRFLRYPDDAARAIEALKGWIAREAAISWGKQAKGAAAEDFAARIAFRQWQILRAARLKAIKRGNISYPLSDNFAALAGAFCGAQQGRESWIALMNVLGKEVRKCKAAKITASPGICRSS